MKKPATALLLLAAATAGLWAAGLDAPATLANQQPPTEWWPRFLGPRFNGTAPDKGLNWDWKKTPPKTVWKVPLGAGFSSFSVIGDHAYTMCERDKRNIVVCLDKNSGNEVWTHDVSAGYLDKQKQGAGPRGTPTYHNGRLYCLMPMGELVCLAAADGKRIWLANQFTDTGAANPAGEQLYWGVAVSPLVEGDLVIVQPGGDNNNSVAAYHKDTGKLVWTAASDANCYGSPQAVTIDGQRQLVVPTGSSVLGIEPNKGKVLWRYEMAPKKSSICSTPIWLGGNRLWISAAYQVGCGVLEIKKQGDAWTVSEKWKNKKSLLTLYSNPMVVDGHVFGCHGDLSAFMLKCVDLANGDVKWEERLDNREWLLAVDGHLLCWSELGRLKVLEINSTAFVQKAEFLNLLPGKRVWAAPVLADGRLYLRDQKNALCIDLRKP